MGFSKDCKFEIKESLRGRLEGRKAVAREVHILYPGLSGAACFKIAKRVAYWSPCSDEAAIGEIGAEIGSQLAMAGTGKRFLRPKDGYPLCMGTVALGLMSILEGNSSRIRKAAQMWAVYS